VVEHVTRESEESISSHPAIAEVAEADPPKDLVVAK
jgi:hypothetical protein